jgi:putative salt-induced outer membrane protein
LKSVVCSVLLATVAGPVHASPLPDAIRAMLETAIATNDPATIAAVVSVARRTAPDSAAEIDAIAAVYNDRLSAENAARAREDATRIARAGPLSLWKGSVELGGSRSSGAGRILDIYSGLDLTRVGIDWTQKLTAHAEYQRTNHAPTTERVTLAYQPQVKLDPAFYAYGLGQYEHDRFQGYRNRYTAGLGLGVSPVNRPDLKIELEVGPAARITDFYAMSTQTRLAARGSFNLKWRLSPTITFAEGVALYLEKGDTTAKSAASLETTLLGPLKARLSYDLQFESDAPAGQKSLDTTSRVSLVYGF